MEEYLVHTVTGKVLRIKTVRLELRDGALIFYFDEVPEIARIIAAGQWIEVIRAIDINGDPA